MFTIIKLVFGVQFLESQELLYFHVSGDFSFPMMLYYTPLLRFARTAVLESVWCQGMHRPPHRPRPRSQPRPRSLFRLCHLKHETLVGGWVVWVELCILCFAPLGLACLVSASASVSQRRPRPRHRPRPPEPPEPRRTSPEPPEPHPEPPEPLPP